MQARSEDRRIYVSACSKSAEMEELYIFSLQAEDMNDLRAELDWSLALEL